MARSINSSSRLILCNHSNLCGGKIFVSLNKIVKSEEEKSFAFTMNLMKSSRRLIPNLMRVVQLRFKGEQGEPVGSAGAIGQAGGAFGKLCAAKEAEYFHREQVEQLKKMSPKKATIKRKDSK